MNQSDLNSGSNCEESGGQILFLIYIYISKNILKVFQSFFGLHSSISFLGLPNKIPQAGWLKQQNFVVSQFYRLEIRNQGVGRVGSS